MHAERLIVGEFQANCYIVHDDHGGSAVIDPGGEPERIVGALRGKGLVPRYVVNTHAHIDHIAANTAVLDAFPTAELVCGRQAVKRLTSTMANLSALFLRPYKSPVASVVLADGEVLTVGEMSLTVIETPGHTPGSICLLAGYEKGPLFSGDTLFQEGVGRTDLPGGNMKMLVASIRDRLFTLPETVEVYPGHGPPTTIGREKASNPFVRA